MAVQNTTVVNGNVAVTQIQLSAAVADTVALSQQPAAAGNLVLNGASVSGGVATLDTVRRVAVASDGVDTAAKFTITGTDRYNNVQSEVVTGVNAASVSSVLDYKTVTQVAIDRAAVGHITVGTNAKASGAWIMGNIQLTQFQVALGYHIVSGAVTGTVEHTYDDPNAALPGSIEPASNIPPVAWPDPTIVTKATDTESSFTTPFFAWRLTVTAGQGLAMLQSIQAGQSN